MRLTTRSEYALLALIYLGRNEGKRVSVTEISQEQKIPAKFLEQICGALRDQGYISSSKGRGGGYMLAQPAGDISLAQIVRLFDGALAPSDSVSKFYYRSTPLEREAKLMNIMRKVRAAVVEIMEGATLEDIL